MNQTEQTQLPEDLRHELLEQAAHLLRSYSGFEYRRFVKWYPEALHIGEARDYVLLNSNTMYQNALRTKAIRPDTEKRHQFRKVLRDIVEEAANVIGYPRAAPEKFPTNFAYVPVKR